MIKRTQFEFFFIVMIDMTMKKGYSGSKERSRMQISSRFTIAIHILVYVATYHEEERITSDVLAQSIQVNPVIIRNILTQLKRSELIAVKRGQGGVSILPAYEDISLLAIYQAVESIKNNQLFSFHSQPNQNCPVGRGFTPCLMTSWSGFSQLWSENWLVSVYRSCW